MPNLSGFENFYCRPYSREACNKKGLGPPRGVGELNKVWFGEAPPWGPAPDPIIYRFGIFYDTFYWKKGTPFRYLR